MFDKDQEARQLAAAHYAAEAGIRAIYRLCSESNLESRASEPIKLLEVNENTIAVGVMPLEFGPAAEQGIHFASIIVEVTPDEFERIRRHELPLPLNWTLGDLLPPAKTSAVA